MEYRGTVTPWSIPTISGLPRPSMAIFAAMDDPQIKYGCLRWFALAASGPPLFFSLQFLE